MYILFLEFQYLLCICGCFIDLEWVGNVNLQKGYNMTFAVCTLFLIFSWEATLSFEMLICFSVRPFAIQGGSWDSSEDFLYKWASNMQLIFTLVSQPGYKRQSSILLFLWNSIGIFFPFFRPGHYPYFNVFMSHAWHLKNLNAIHFVYTLCLFSLRWGEI